MTIRIAQDEQGNRLISVAEHKGVLFCDLCGASKNIDLSVSGRLVVSGSQTKAISISCAELSGKCSAVTFWPIENGTEDAKAIVAAKIY